MRKLIMFNMISVDGFFEAPGHSIDWHTVDEAFNEFAIEQLDSAGALVFGRITYDLMASYWPTAEAKADDPEVTQRMNAMQKVVASRTMKQADWEHTSIVHDAVAELPRLKEQPGNDIFLFGSANLAASLIGAGLIDEFRLMVSPVVLGAGTPLFANRPERLSLELLDARSFPNGNTLLRYVPRG